MASLALIPDASVVAKWLLSEVDSEKARFLRDLYLTDEVELIAPTLLYVEVANALRHDKLVPPAALDEFMEDLYGYDMETVPFTLPVATRAIADSRSLGVTVYDATYLAVAKQRGGVLVTADKKFELRAKSRHVATLDKVYGEFAR